MYTGTPTHLTKGDSPSASIITKQLNFYKLHEHIHTLNTSIQLTTDNCTWAPSTRRNIKFTQNQRHKSSNYKSYSNYYTTECLT